MNVALRARATILGLALLALSGIVPARASLLVYAGLHHTLSVIVFAENLM